MKITAKVWCHLYNSMPAVQDCAATGELCTTSPTVSGSRSSSPRCPAPASRSATRRSPRGTRWSRVVNEISRMWQQYNVNLNTHWKSRPRPSWVSSPSRTGTGCPGVSSTTRLVHYNINQTILTCLTEIVFQLENCHWNMYEHTNWMCMWRLGSANIIYPSILQ